MTTYAAEATADGSRVRGASDRQCRNGLGEQASRSRTGHPLPRREAIRHRDRAGPGGTRRVHPGDNHQRGEMSARASTVMKHHPEPGRSKTLARSYDYVIVGAGSAGCVVARRLVEGTDATVIVLEAGGTGKGEGSLSN